MFILLSRKHAIYSSTIARLSNLPFLDHLSLRFDVEESELFVYQVSALYTTLVGSNRVSHQMYSIMTNHIANRIIYALSNIVSLLYTR